MRCYLCRFESDLTKDHIPPISYAPVIPQSCVASLAT